MSNDDHMQPYANGGPVSRPRSAYDRGEETIGHWWGVNDPVRSDEEEWVLYVIRQLANEPD
ncbi:hypothetical protein ACFLQN_04790 [Candidatus Aenigmatarchaeota archaeon]